MGRLARTDQPDFSLTPELAFGLTLRKSRLKRGLSQQRLADQSGYHRTYIGLLESGKKSPSLRTVFNIAATLRVKPSLIVAGIERLLAHNEKKAH